MVWSLWGRSREEISLRPGRACDTVESLGPSSGLCVCALVLVLVLSDLPGDADRVGFAERSALQPDGSVCRCQQSVDGAAGDLPARPLSSRRPGNNQPLVASPEHVQPVGLEATWRLLKAFLRDIRAAATV